MTIRTYEYVCAFLHRNIDVLYIFFILLIYTILCNFNNFSMVQIIYSMFYLTGQEGQQEKNML